MLLPALLKKKACLFTFVVVVIVAMFGGRRAYAAAPKTDVEKGQSLIRIKGCTACHSMDGTPRVGPTFKGMWGKPRPVQASGDTSTVTVDEAYLARSLRDPDAEIAAGYPRGNMPRFDATDDEVKAIAAALREVDTAPGNVVSSSERGGSILPLALSAASFAFLHFIFSSIPVRTRVIGAIGAKGFSVVYSILAFASFIAMIWFYRTAPYIEVWSPPRWTRWVPVLAMPFALLFLIAGFSTPSPTAVGQADKAKEEPKGIQAITRHPALWGFATWALAHLSTNGELHVILVALSILVLAIGGMIHIDSRRQAQMGAAWTEYAGKTSVIPFAALVGGRTKLRLREIGIVRVLITAFIYYAFLHAHALVIGASPYP